MAQQFDSVVIDISKLRDYCLSEIHPRGRYKARVFRATLGLTAADAELLRDALLNAVRDRPDELRASESDEYGQRYELVDNRCRFRVNPVGMDCSCPPARATLDKLLCVEGELTVPHSNAIKLLDVVALTVDLPQRGLVRGQVGTVVEILGTGVFEVEFSDDEGRTYAELPLRESELLVLHYRTAA